MEADLPSYNVTNTQDGEAQAPIYRPPTLTTVLDTVDFRHKILRQTNKLPLLAQVSKDFKRYAEEEFALPPSIYFELSFPGCWRWKNWFVDSDNNFSRAKGPTNINLIAHKCMYMNDKLTFFKDKRGNRLTSLYLDCDALFIADIMQSKFELVQPLIAAQMLQEHYTCLRILCNACTYQLPIHNISRVHLYNLYLDNTNAITIANMLRDCENVTDLTLEKVAVYEDGQGSYRNFVSKDWWFFGDSFYNLTSFTLKDCDLVDTGDHTVLDGMSSATKLTSLTLNNCNLGNDAGILSVGDTAIVEKSTLTRLDLSNNHISNLYARQDGDEYYDITHESVIEECPNLREVIFKNNAFSQQQIIGLHNTSIATTQNDQITGQARLIMH